MCWNHCIMLITLTLTLNINWNIDSVGAMSSNQCFLGKFDGTWIITWSVHSSCMYVAMNSRLATLPPTTISSRFVAASIRFCSLDTNYTLQTTTWPFFRQLHLWWTFPETHVIKSLYDLIHVIKSSFWSIFETLMNLFDYFCWVIHFISTFFFFFKNWVSIWLFYDLCASV